MQCFVLYRHAGGSCEAKEATENITEFIDDGIGDDFAMPILIKGDLNRTPSEISTVKRWIEDDSWTDVGSVASWRGGKDNQPTCQNPAGRKSNEDRRHRGE